MESHFSRWGTRRAVITPLTDYVFGNAEAALFVLLGGGMLLLLIACTNVTGLMIVRSQSRRRDAAVQCALGTSYLNLVQVDLGYRPAEVLALTLTPRAGVYEADTARRAAYRDLLARIRELRGVEAVGGTLLLPFEHGVVGMDGGVVLEGEPLDGPSADAWSRSARRPSPTSLRRGKPSSVSSRTRGTGSSNAGDSTSTCPSPRYRRA